METSRQRRARIIKSTLENIKTGGYRYSLLFNRYSYIHYPDSVSTESKTRRLGAQHHNILQELVKDGKLEIVNKYYEIREDIKDV